MQACCLYLPQEILSSGGMLWASRRGGTWRCRGMELGALGVRCRRVDVEVERNVALQARCGCVDVDV